MISRKKEGINEKKILKNKKRKKYFPISMVCIMTFANHITSHTAFKRKKGQNNSRYYLISFPLKFIINWFSLFHGGKNFTIRRELFFPFYK